jgi:LL-diaminopimelate aminotransferase
VWARVPEGYTSAGFAEKVLEEANVIVAPGNSYGPSGEGYIRISWLLRTIVSKKPSPNRGHALKVTLHR